MALRVLLADDHLIFRQGLKRLLEREGFEVVGEAADGCEAVRLVETTSPHVAVLDLSMPLMDGLDAAREIASASPRTRTILLTMYAEDAYVMRALHSGARGYLPKTQSAEELVKAINEVARGGTYVSRGVSAGILQTDVSRADPRPSPLSARERQVLQLVAEGMTTKEIAKSLAISAKTADSYRTRIMAKLDIHATAGLVRYAVRHGLIQP